MSTRVAVMLGEGFEPIEAIAPVDILRRGGVEVTTVSVMPNLNVEAAHGVTVQADAALGEVDLAGFDLLLLPGGALGVQNLGACQPLREALVAAAREGRRIAAICAGPMILAELGLLEGHEATCYPGCEGGFPAGAYRGDVNVCRSGNLITANGPASALDFGFEVLRALKGDEVAERIASDMQR